MLKAINFATFKICISDLLYSNDVMAMKDIKQHRKINCLEHSLFVSYISYRICRFLGWDCVAAARGGLLHDLFLYDQHRQDSHVGNHLSSHPKAAFENARKLCDLTDIEKDIILKHMWPLTLKLPKYKESFVVNIIDTLCAAIEALSIYSWMNTRTNLMSLLKLPLWVG